MKGLVSIIIPCYNGEKFIHETLDSVFRQTYSNYEILFVDDGSTDNSAEIAKASFLGKPFCKYLYQKNNGVSSARNKGLQEARGEFVLFLDADDVLEESFLSCRVRFLSSEPAYGLCGTNILRIDSQGLVISEAKTMQAPDDNMLNQILLYQQPYESVPSNLLIRRQVMIDHSIFFEESLSSTADKYFLCCLSKFTECKNIDGGKLLYRISEDSMSHSVTSKLLSDNAKYFKLLKENHVVPDKIYSTVAKKNYYMLAGLAFRLKDYRNTIIYFLKYSLVRLRVLKS